MKKVYIFICESSKDFGSEVRLYEHEENAKEAVRKIYEEYVERKHYVPNDENSYKNAKEDYIERDKTGFTIMLYDNERFECHYEEAIYSDPKHKGE